VENAPKGDMQAASSPRPSSIPSTLWRYICTI
jgi:hypothetical protein